MDPCGVYDYLQPAGSKKRSRKTPTTLPEQLQRLKDERKASTRPPKGGGDSSDSDHIVDRRVDKGGAKKKRRRRRRNSQKLKKLTTSGVMNDRVATATAKVEGRVEESITRSDVVADMDAKRITGFENDLPSLRPMSDAISHFAMNARKSARAVREEVAEGIGDAVDADIAAASEDELPVLDPAPDEYQALYQDCAMAAGGGDKSSMLLKLIQNEEARDRSYRNATVRLMGLRLSSGGGSCDGDPAPPQLQPPDLGTSCDKAYCARYLREAILPLERPCVRGRFKCVGMMKQQTWPDTLEATAKPETGIVGREFWRPEEWAEIVAKGRLPSDVRRKCLLCNRWVTKRAYMSLKSTGLSAQGCYLIQDHFNAVSEDGTAGGYTAHDMLSVVDEKSGRWTGLVAPIVDYRGSRYEPRIHEVWDSDLDEMRKVKGFVEKDQDF